MTYTNEDIIAERTRQAQLAADAARLARDPVAGAYMFGALTTTLAEVNRLCYLRNAVTCADAFAAAGRTPASDAAEIRQTMASLTRYLAAWPAAFGKAGRESVAEARQVLAQAAAALEAGDDDADPGSL